VSSNRDFTDVTTDRAYRYDHPCASHVRILDADAGIIERTRTKLAIVGYATSTRDLAPMDDPEYDICALNQIYRFLPRIDIHADIHRNWDEENVEGTDHEGWIRDCGIPVLMMERNPGLPTSVRFPIDECIKIGTDYFTSTVALLIAWGIHQGYTTIGLWGIDLVVGTEYVHQRQCAEFWLGVAHGRGINIVIPQASALLKHTHRYGYEKEPDSKLMKLSDVEARRDMLVKQREELVTRLRAFDGAIGEVNRLQTELASGMVVTPESVGERQKWLTDSRFETMMNLATMDGALQESEFMRQVMELRARGADIALRP
jgi:hypothetical protein